MYVPGLYCKNFIFCSCGWNSNRPGDVIPGPYENVIVDCRKWRNLKTAPTFLRVSLLLSVQNHENQNHEIRQNHENKSKSFC